MASVYTDSKNKVFNPLLDGVVDLRDKKKRLSFAKRGNVFA